MSKDNGEADRALLVTEYAEIRQELWMLIAVVKQVVHTMPARERAQLLQKAMHAEEVLTHE